MFAFPVLNLCINESPDYQLISQNFLLCFVVTIYLSNLFFVFCGSFEEEKVILCKNFCGLKICHNLFGDFLWQNNWRIVLWLAALPLPPIRQHHNHNLSPDLQTCFTWFYHLPPLVPQQNPPPFSPPPTKTTPQPQPFTRSTN